MAVNIQIEVRRDRLNFVLPAVAGVALAAVTTAYNYFVINPEISLAVLVAGISFNLGSYGSRKKKAVAYSECIVLCNQGGDQLFKRAGDGNAWCNAAVEVSRRLGCRSYPVYISTDDQMPHGICLSDQVILVGRETALAPFKEEQRIAIMAHEIAHDLLKHPSKYKNLNNICDVSKFNAVMVTAIPIALLTAGVAVPLGLVVMSAVVFATTILASLFVSKKFERNCEYMADDVAARVTSADAMIGGLNKVKAISVEKWGYQLAALILEQQDRSQTRFEWFLPHPPDAKRIARLEAMLSK